MVSRKHESLTICTNLMELRLGLVTLPLDVFASYSSRIENEDRELSGVRPLVTILDDNLH